MKLVLKQPNYEEFDGLFGFVQFKGGVSVDDVSRKDAQLIASAIYAEWEDGTSANPAAVFTEAVQRPVEVAGEDHITPVVEPEIPTEENPAVVAEPEAPAEVVEPAPVEETPAVVDEPAPVEAAPEQAPTEEAPAQVEETPAEEAPAEEAPQPASFTGHTQADLEAIADKQGIKGLRDIATPLGIKGTSIAELIAEILNYKPE